MKSLATLFALVAVAAAVPLPAQHFSHGLETTATLGQLSEALQDPDTNPALVPYLENALNELMVAIFNGQNQDSIALTIPAMEVNSWTLQQLSDAIQSPATDPELKVYLEYALNQLMAALFAGQQVDTIAVMTPPGVIATVPGIGPALAPAPVVIPAPAVVAPEVITPIPTMPVDAPTPVAAGPLVQIIVNVNNAGQIIGTPVLGPQPAIVSPPAEPVTVVEHAPEPVTVVEHAPEPVTVVEHAPETVSVVEHAPVAPGPVNPIDVVAVSPPEINPVDIIGVAVPESVSVVENVPVPESVNVVQAPVAPSPVNPIDVIAVAAPDVNPIDILHPIHVIAN